jgi:tRNA (guanosine-2'-O-)-methyltransferase
VPHDDAIDRLIARHGPDRVIAALAPLLSDDRIQRIDDVLATRLASVTAVVEDVYDPHNAAAAIRTVEALGLAALHVVEVAGGHRFDAPESITRGCDRWLDLRRWTSVGDAARALRDHGFRVYATLPDATATIHDVPVDAPIAAVFGNEHAGLSVDAIAACDGAISIPMFGFTRNFNLSVSVALVVSRLAERRRAYLSAAGDLDRNARHVLRARWFALRIRGAAEIIERSVAS